MSIFGNTDPPRWLQEIAKPIDTRLTGQALGLFLGAGINAIERDPDAPADASWLDSRKGFKMGLEEARKNQQDPQWKLREKALESQVVGNWARSASEWQAYDMTNQDLAQWTTKDLPNLTRFQEELKQDPNATAPVMESSRGQKAMQQIETSRLRKAQMDHTYEMRKAQLENGSAAAKIAVRTTEDFLESLESLPPDAAAAIGAPKGPRIAGQETYSPDQWTQLKAALTANNLPMPGTRRKAGAAGLTPQQKVALDDLKSDEREISKQLIAARASDPDKVPGLQKQLDEVKRKRLKISAMVGAEATGTSIEDILDDSGKPTDAVAQALEDKTAAYKAALVEGDPSKIETAQEELRKAQTQVGRAQAIQKGQVINSENLNQATLDTMKKWPKGTQFYDEATKKWKVFDPALLPALEAQLRKAAEPPKYVMPPVWKGGVLSNP